MMQVAKKVPFEDPNVLNACRGLYVLSNLIIMGIYFYIKTKIDGKKGASFTREYSDLPNPPICLPGC
jgi:hypothetical protein